MGRARRLATILALVSVAVLGTAEASAAKTVWLCKPGLKANPCTPSLSTTVFSPTGEVLRVEHPRRVRRPKFDCFYVYPTVSDQPTLQANRRIDPELRSIALYQAARYSQDCRVYAPVYRQLTTSGILSPDTSPADARAGVRRRARGLAHLPAQVQPRPRRRADQPLAGHLHAARARQARDRPQGRPCGAG